MEFFEYIGADVAAYRQKYTIANLFKLIFIHPGFRAVFIIRFIQLLNPKFKILASLLRVRLLRNYSCDFSPGSTIGKGLKIEHPVGIVIGHKVIIGNFCTISQGVTIGEKYNDSRSTGLYPKLSNNISIGVNAVLLGDITIGENVTIGANSLILANVISNITVVGVHS